MLLLDDGSRSSSPHSSKLSSLVSEAPPTPSPHVCTNSRALDTNDHFPERAMTPVPELLQGTISNSLAGDTSEGPVPSTPRQRSKQYDRQ